MFSKKKTECRVCGYRFTPERENIYTAAGVCEGTWLDAMRRRLPAADY